MVTNVYTKHFNCLYCIQLLPISGVGDAVGAKAASPIVVPGLKETFKLFGNKCGVSPILSSNLEF